MAEQLPKWADVSASPEFQAADSATREAMRMGYREKLAELSYLAGGDDAGVKQHLDGFDKFSKPGVFQRIADRVTGRPTAASAAAMGLSGASEAAAPTAQEIAVASSPSMRMASSGLGRRTAQPSLMVGKFDAQADAAGAGQVAPFSKIGLAAIRDDVAANGINAGDRAITDPTSAVGRARKLAAQGLLGPQVRSPEQMGAEQKPEEQSWLGNAVDANKLLARGAVEGAGSIARAAVEVPGRIGDWYDSKTAYLGARLAGESDEQATLIADKLKASREGMRRDVIDPLAEKGGKILDYLLPIAENTKKETESDIFEGNPLKGEAPTLKQDASLHRVVMKMYQTLGQMAPIVLGGVLTAGAKGGMAAGGALGFAQAADEGGSEESKRIRDLPAAAMREIPLYKQYRAEGLSHEEAVLATSADAGRAASLVQGMLGSLDGLLFPGAGAAARKSIAKVALKDGAVQSMQEAAESAGSRTAASLAVGEKLDPERIGKGLYDDAALGAVTGKVIGGSQAAGSNAALKAEEQASAKFDASIKQGIADKVASTFGRPTPVTDGITVAPETKATSGSRSSNPVIQKNATVIQDEPVSADVLLGTRPKSPVDIAAHEAATSPLNDKPEPTQAQKEAGTYAKGHTKIAGLDIAIENPQGSVRKGVDADGKAWENTLRDHYGYVKGTIGNDKDAVDTFIKAGTQPSHSGPVFVVDQVDPKTGKLDEHKAIIGAANEAEARTIYQRNYAKDWNGLGAITQLPIAAFKSWVKDGAKREPLGDITGWKAEPKATASAPAKDTSLKPTATLAQAIRKFGGLPEKFARDLTGEPAMTANKMPGYRGLFHASGTDLSTLVHDGKLDAYLPPNLRSDVRDDSRPTDTDAAVAHIEAILRNGEAQTAKSYARTEAKQQRLTAAAQKQQVVAPIEKGDTQASADAISEAEYEHFKQTGEPGFGWMPGAETFADSLDANTIEQLDALLNLPESADERAAMRSMGFTEDEITETLGPDAAASAGTNQVPESASAASESAPASREAAPPAAEVTKTGDERARDAELFRKTKSRLIAAFTGKSGESFDDLSKTLTARANDKNDPQSKLAAEVLDNFDGWKGNYEQRQAFEKNRESANPNEAAAKALESAAAALREVGKPSAKPADNDFLSELFGRPSSQPAEPQQQQKSGQRGIAAIRAAIRSAIDSAIRERDDWSSRNYKANKKQVELRGDGPGNNAAMSVGSINESRRNKAIESLNQEIAALGKLEKQVSSDSGATQVMAGMSEIMETAKRSYESGNYPGRTVNDLFESILLDRLKFRGPGGKGSVTSNGLSKAALSAITEQTRPTLDLTNPTESKLRTDDAKQKRDAAEKAAKENAPPPEEFGLVGSNRAADVGAAAGQKDLLAEKPAEKRKTDKTTAVYEALLKKKSTRLLKDHGNGRILYDVTITPEFRNANFVHGRMPRADGFELRDKADITGNPFDKGYVLIDNREQLRARGEPLFSRASGKNAGMANDKNVVGNTTGRSADDSTPGAAKQSFREWFKDSKVVDDQGNPLVVYHGADNDIREFSKEMLGRNTNANSARKGFFFAGHPQTTYAYMEQGVSGSEAIIMASYGWTMDKLRAKQKQYRDENNLPEWQEVDYDWLQNESDRWNTRKEYASKLKVLRSYANGYGLLRKGKRQLTDAELYEKSRIEEWLKEDQSLIQMAQNSSVGQYDGEAGSDEWESHIDNKLGWKKSGAAIYASYLAIKNPAVFDDVESGYREQSFSERMDIAIANGNDGVIIKNTHDGFRSNDTIYVVFEPSQIRSAIGVNPNESTAPDSGGALARGVDQTGAEANPDIRFSRAKDSVAAKRDAEYMAAIDAGDMEAAQRIVDQAAVDAGYVSHSDFRMSHRAPDRSDTNLGKVKSADLVPADYWTHPQWYQGTPEENESFWKVRSLLDKAESNPEKGERFAMPVYRAVPKSTKEDKFRNGDWVTPSRSYAEAEGRNIPGGYRIIEMRAQLRYLWWDGNSIAELGYDNGNEYAYKNTTNNRKLTDVITRDDDGNIIPPSKRFNYRNADARFSREAPLWRSTLTEAIGKTSFAQAPADQWKAWLNANAAKLGVKKDEIEWSGVTDWLDLQKGKVTRDQVREFLDANGVKVTETMLADGEYEPTFVEQDDDGMWRVYGERANEGDVYDTAEQANAKSEEYNADIPAGPSKYSNYQLPGGTNYRELLLTLPKSVPTQEFRSIAQMKDFLQNNPRADLDGMSDLDKFKAINKERRKAGDQQKDFQSSHWDQPNILAHIRFNERADADGKRVLFIEEIQSDWGQEGKKKGFARSKEAIQIEFDKVRQQYLDTPRSSPSFAAIEQRMGELRNENGNGTPSAPFIGKTEAWVSLALKRMIRYAVDNGFDRIAMVNGEQSAERYDLSKSVDSLLYKKNGDGTFSLSAITQGRGNPMGDAIPEAKLEDYVGKDIAKKIVNGDGKRTEVQGKYNPVSMTSSKDYMQELSGVDLKVGGEGMKAFYDRIVPQVANDVLKKLGGGKVGTIEIGKGGWDVYRTDERTDEPEIVRANVKTEALANDIASDYLGGHVKRAQGQQPGFDITDKMREHAAQGMPLFRRDEQQPTTANTHAADVIAKAAKTVNIPLDVYATPREASAKLGIDIPSDVRGLHYRGRAALISSNITTPAMGEFVLWHELLHAGITQVAPRYGNEYNRIMQDMAARNSNIIKAARDWRNSYGAETIKRSMDAGLSQEQAEKRMRLMAIEEAIADLAGANVELKGWQQFVAKLQALLRSMGFDNLANWIEGKSNAEVLQLIARTRDEVTTQNLHLTTQVPAFARDEDDASYQRAYHGTPHKFDKFSLDKIGTGEGAQAYGYGLYFASKREIAEHYRNTLASQRGFSYKGQSGLTRAEVQDLVNAEVGGKYLDGVARGSGVADTVIDDMMVGTLRKDGQLPKQYKAGSERAALYEKLKGEITHADPGALYQVDIPEDSEMLHWDKPLSEQSDEVKALANKYDYPLSRTGGDFQKWASSASGGLTINIRGPKDRAGLEKQASDLFKKNGIRGIKYLDGGSRNAGDGSYNYVVFDDKDVNIEAVHSRADTIEVDGKARARSNSNGKPIATTDEGLRNFWKWFGDSKAVDAYGKPLVVYHGAPDARFVNQDGTFKTLGERYGGNEPDKRAFWFSKDRRTASTYADDRRAFDYQNAEAGIVDAYIRLENPLIVDANGDYWRTAQRRGKTSDVIAEARAAGNDGAIVRDVKDEYNNIKGTASTTTYTVFSSNQIKSATNNTGQFSPDNADIRFSRNEQTTSQDGDVAFSRSGSGDIFDKNATDAQSTYNGTEAVQGIGASVKNVIRQTANIARDKRGAALSFLGGRQIADIYSKDVPELPRYNEILQRMQAEQNEGSAVADSIIEKWRVINRKRPDVATQLSSLMHDSTLAQVDPDVSADNAELRKRWINLPQEAKDIYREARDAYVAHFEKVKAELIDRVERSALDTSAKNRTLASMREEFTKAMKGVYFPLARFGDYMVVVKDKAGVTQSVSMAETTNQAQALRAELLRAYPDYVVGAIQKKKEFNAERDGVSRGFMKDLVALINEEPDAQTRDSQLDAINQLWLSSLPDLSWAKSGIHRKGTPGYSNDAMRAFARNMFHGGYHLAKLRYGDRLGDTLAQMQETIDNKVRSNPEYSNVVAQSVVDEMNARHKHVMNPQNTPVANALTGLGFMWHMGLSPASAVVNLSQTALVAYPMLASKFGFGKAATMLLSLSADAVKGKNDLLSQLQGAEKDAYDRAVREGLIDITMAHDLAGVSQGKSGEFNEKQQRVMRVASVMFHEAEKFNRGVTFMSAYRLAVQSGVSDPYKLAHDLTFDSHFDYSSQNRPRVMQGPTARVVLLFKQYGQNMIYTLSRNTFKALQGDREAQKTLAGLLAMHGMFAGALGLPLMTTLLAAASAIGGSDDEPWDAQVALRNYLADAFGKDIGEVLAHGVFRAPGIKDAIGADISGRVGLDSMLIRMPQETLEGKKYYQALLETIAGPVFGIGGNIANGMQTMAQGNTLRGIEEMLPKSIKDPLKAYRYEQDGIQDKTGITIVDETTIPEEVAQFLGFSPARGMEGFEGKSAIKNQEALLTQRRRQLMQRYGKDAEEGDTADSLVAIQRWNIANPTMAIKGQDLLRSMREKAKRQAEAENGAYLSKKRRGLAELGEFANAE